LFALDRVTVCCFLVRHLILLRSLAFLDFAFVVVLLLADWMLTRVFGYFAA